MPIDINENILRSINGALQSRKLYPAGHPSMMAPARKSAQLVAEALKTSSKFIIGVVEESLVCDEVPIEDAEDNFPDLWACINKRSIEAIIFEKGVTDKEMSAIFDILSEEGPLSPGDIPRELKNKGIMHITIKSFEKRNIIEVYNDAIEVVKNVMGEIRLGKIPKSEPVKKVVNDLSELVLSDTNAMIGLTMIKNYDDYLYNHSVNVSILSLSLGKQMKLKTEDLHTLGVAGLLHDVGKTGVSEDIIKKPGGLSSEEWEKVKEHPVLGANITKRMDGLNDTICRIIFEHHVRYDKTGYPKVENAVHPLSIIVCVADAYDALTTLRVYQKPYQPVEAIKILKGLSGKHFDPATILAFENMIGMYPVGTLVRLSTNEVGIVTKVNNAAFDKPTIKIMYSADGSELPMPKETDLSENAHAALSIVSQVDPLARNVDAGAFVAKEAAGA
ncbi:MAG: HD-GYP domain-containing protein [Deltaproteobacteria bacterium]|nr:HD-GYP domain-containing protein [Deltaproteobacteria bacterium]